MSKIFITTVRRTTVTGGGGGAPTGTWSEDAASDDALKSVHVITPENVGVDDAFAYLIVKEGEDVPVDDSWRATVVSANAEDVPVNDLAKIQILNVDVARTGTPDSDMIFDAYTNQLAAFAGTNFGNATLQCRGVTTVTPGSDEQRAYVCFDLTALTGFTGIDVLPGSWAFTATWQIANSNALTATTCTVQAYYNAAKPFTESTVTWNAPPSLGTLISTGTFSVPAGGGFTGFPLSLTGAQLSLALGKYMTWVFTGPSAATTLLVDTFTIKSRDDATAGNRPKFSIAVQRGT